MRLADVEFQNVLAAPADVERTVESGHGGMSNTVPEGGEPPQERVAGRRASDRSPTDEVGVNRVDHHTPSPVITHIP